MAKKKKQQTLDEKIDALTYGKPAKIEFERYYYTGKKENMPVITKHQPV